MNPDGQIADGWLAAVRRLVDSLLGLVQSRFALFVAELQREKLRTVDLAVRLVIALALGVGGLLVGLGLMSIWLWELWGYLGVAAFALVLLAAAAGILAGIRHQIRNGPLPFTETLDGFQKGRDWLRSGS